MNANGITPAAESYAQAIIDLAGDKADDLGEELRQLAAIVAADNLFRSFLTDPGISIQERWSVIERVFAGRIGELLFNTLGVLNQKNRLALLPQIAEAYANLLDKLRNRVRVQVTLAKELQGQELADVTARISQGLGREAIVEQKVDPGIIGGIVLQVNDKIIDGSVLAQLQAMRKQLLASHK